MGGKGFREEPPRSAALTFADDDSVVLKAPTRLIDQAPDVSSDIVGYTFETPGKPETMTVALDDPDETADAVVAYYTRPLTNTRASGAFSTTLQYAWGGDDGRDAVGTATLTLTLTLPAPLPHAMEVQVRVAVMDKDPQQGSDQRIVIVRAEAGGAAADVTLTDPDEELVNIVTLVLADVPAGTQDVQVALVSPLTPAGESQWNNPAAGDSVMLLGASAWHMCPEPTATSTPPPTSSCLPQKEGLQQGSDTAIGGGVAEDNYIFWIDVRDENAAIYGYDLCHQEEFLIKSIGKPWNVFSLTTEGKTLAWVARSDAGQSVQGYDLSSRYEFTIVQADRYGFDSIALGNGVLYYTYLAPEQPGIYAYTLTTGQKEVINPQGYDLVFADGKLLWTQDHVSGDAVSEKSLHIKNLDTGEQTVVTQVSNNGYTYFSGYDAFGNTVVWSFLPGTDTHVKSYNLSSGISTTLSTNSGYYPVIRGTMVMWYEVLSENESVKRSIVMYEIVSEERRVVVEESTTNLRTVDILEDGRLSFMVKDPSRGRESLYISDSEQSDLRFFRKDLGVSGQLSSGWGRIGTQGRWLYEAVDMSFDK